MADHDCVYEGIIKKIDSKQDKIDDKQDQLLSDIAVIKAVLLGNGTEGLTKKVERNTRYIYMASGALVLLSFAIANVTRYIFK